MSSGSSHANMDVYFTKSKFNEALGERVVESYSPGPLDQSTREHLEEFYTPLRRAAGFGRVEIVKYLLENGADINANSLFGCGLHSHLNRRRRYGREESDRLTFNALHLAIELDRCNVAKILVERGINLEFAPLKPGHDSGITALHQVAAHPLTATDTSLLEVIAKRPGVDVNAVDIDGQPPLLYAAECQVPSHRLPSERWHDEFFLDPSLIISTLLRLGANLDMSVLLRGETALDFRRETIEDWQGSLFRALMRRWRFKAALCLINQGANTERRPGEELSVMEEVFDSMQKARRLYCFDRRVTDLDILEILEKKFEGDLPVGTKPPKEKDWRSLIVKVEWNGTSCFMIREPDPVIINYHPGTDLR